MAKYSNQVVYDIRTTLDASGITKLQSELSKVQTTLNSLTGKKGIKLGLDVDELEMYRFEVEKLSKVLTTSFNTRTGMLDLNKFNAALNKGTINAERLGAAFNAAGSQGKVAFNSLVTSITTLNKNAITANSTLTKIANTFGNTVRWGITASIFQEMLGSVQNAVSYMKDLDESLTNIQMVTGSSKEDMRELAQYANSAAQALGSTTTDYTNAVKVFVQEGFSESESKQYANLSTKLANVSEQNTATTSDQITAYRNAFQLDYEQTVEAMDKVASVANNTASNVNELMTASQRAASVAQAVGSSQDSFLAAIATIESVTRQSAEEIGNGLKTIYQRFADIKVGKSTEDGVEYGQYAQALKSVGVDVLDAAGEFKGMDQILQELQEVWGSLSETMKIAVGEKVAGKFQYNRFAALMNNPKYYQKSLNATQGATGMMDQMNDIYMEGIEGRMKTLQAAGEQVMSTLFNQDDIEPIIGAATDFLNIINSIFDSIGGGIPVLTALSSVLLRTFSAQIGEQTARIATNIKAISQGNQNSQLISASLTKVKDMAPEGSTQAYDFASRTAGTVKGLSDNTQQQWSKTVAKTAEIERQMVATENEYHDTIKMVNATLQKRAGKQKEIIQFSAEELQLGEEKFEIEEEQITQKLKENRVIRENKNLTQQEVIEKAREIEDLLPEELNLKKQILQAAEAAKNAQAEGRYQEQVNAQYEEQLNLEAKAQQFTRLSSALMNSIFLLQSFNNIWNTLADEDLSAQEKATAILSNMAMTLPMVIMLMTELKGLKLADTVVTIQNTAAEIANKAAKLGSAGIQSVVTALFGAEAAAKLADTLATEGLTVAQWALNVAMDANPIGAVILLITALVAIIAAATAGIYALVRSFQNENKKLEEQKAILKDMKENYSDLVDSINELSSAMDKIKDKKDALQGLTKGTTEWRQAVAELNEEVLTLLENYPELAQYITTGENGVLQIDEKGLEEFYNNQLDSAKKLSDATLVQQNKVLEQSNKAAAEEFAQKYGIGLFGSGTASVEEALKQGKDGLKQLNLTTQEAEQAYYKLLKGVDKNTLAIDTNNSLIGQSGNYTSYSSVDSSKFDDAAKQAAISKYGEAGVNWTSAVSPTINAFMGNKAAGIQLKNSETTKEALAEALGVSASNLKIKNSDVNNTTYQVDGQEEVTKSTDEIIEMLANLEQTEMISAERAERDKALYEAMGATAVEINGTIDHFEDASGHVINSLADLDLSSLTRTNKYGMTVAETTENLQLKLGLSEEDAANLHDQIQAKIDSEGAFELSYSFEEADEAIEKDELFGKSTLAQFLEGGQTLKYLNELDKALGEDIDAFTLLTDKTLDTRLEMIKLEQATNAYNETLRENQNNTKAVALNDIANQVKALGEESEESNQKLKNLLDEINRENPELLFSLGIEYDGENVSIDDVTRQIEDNLLALTEEDFTISIQAVTNLDDTTEDVINSLENVTGAAEKINSDFTVSYEDLEDVVAAFPGILGENGNAYATYADGTIQLNSEIAQAAIDAAQTDKDATVEAQIEKIEAQKVALDAAIAGYQSEIDAAIEMNNAQGVSEAEKENFIRESVERVAGYNDELAKASIEASGEMSIAAQKSELEQQKAKADTTDLSAENDKRAGNNFASLLAGIATNVGNFISAVIGPLGNAIISAFTGQPVSNLVSNVLFNGSNIQSAARGAQSQVSTEVNPYSSKFNGLDGYIEYLQQDRKILEQTRNTLDAHEAKLRAIQGKSIQQSDIANKPDKNKNNNNKNKDNKDDGKWVKEKDKQNSDWDYLTNITDDLNRAAAAMEKMAKLEDRLFGANRVSQLKKLQGEYKKYIKLLDQERKAAEKHAQTLRSSAYDENGNLTMNAYAHRAGISQLQFDSEGNLENGEAIEKALLNKINAAVAEYNQHLGDKDNTQYAAAVEAAQEDYQGFMKALSEYQSTLGKIEDTKSAIQDYKEKIQDAADAVVDAIQEGIENVLKAMDSQREFNKMYKDWQQGGSSYSHFGNDANYYEEGLQSLLSPTSGGQSIFDMQIESLSDRIKDVKDVFDINKKDDKDADDEKLSQQDAFDNLQGATEDVMESLRKIVSYYDSLLSTIQEASDKMDELIDNRLAEFDDITDFLDTRLDQIQLLFGDKSYEQQAQIYEQKIATNMEKMVSINEAIEAKKDVVEALEKLEASGKELSTEERKELQDAREKVSELQKEQLNTETQILQDIQSQKRAVVTSEMNKMLKELFGGADVDWLSEQWELATRNSEKYLDDYNRAYEIQKLQLKFQEALSDNQNSSLAAQKKINALANEYLTYLREKENLSEYDVKHAQMQLDILQKQIALEDARNNKSQMQLQRNAAGNYDFVYAADEKAINQATEALLQAQQDSYNLSKQIYLDTYEAAYEAAMKTRDMIVEIAMDASLTAEEQTERIHYALESLNEYLQGSSIELGEIGVNLYNSFVEASWSIAEVNQGALSDIFEQMKQNAIALEEQIGITTDNIKNQINGALEETSINIGTSMGSVSEQFAMFDEDIGTKIANIHGNIYEVIGATRDSIIGEEGSLPGIESRIGEFEQGLIGEDGTLNKIRVGTDTTMLGIKDEIISPVLAGIDERFNLSQGNALLDITGIETAVQNASINITGTTTKSLNDIDAKVKEKLISIHGGIKDTDGNIEMIVKGSVTRIQNNGEVVKGVYNNLDAHLKEKFNNITKKGGYLQQFEQATKDTLKVAKDDYENFTKQSVDYAAERLDNVKGKTNAWKTDLDTLKITIEQTANKMTYWKNKIDAAMKKADEFVTKSNEMQTGLGNTAAISGIASSMLDNFASSAYNAGYALQSMASNIAGGYQYIAAAAQEAANAYDNMKWYADNAAAAANNASWAAQDAKSNLDAVSGAAPPGYEWDIGQTVNNIKDWISNFLGGLKPSGFTSSGGGKFGYNEPGNIWQLGNTWNFMDTGGYTGDWNDRGIGEKNGKLAILHKKELVLSASDTENMLSAVEIVRDIMSGINTLPSIGKNIGQDNYGDTIEQRVEINATFPGVTEAIEIKQALEQLADNAYQVANKYKY